jgi:hypothetical protein
MKWIHPNLSQIARVGAVVFLTGQIGCRTPSGGVANPFLAPDRVPPPATRALLPGQAQPYYPGDPLPVMQSSTERQEEVVKNERLAWGAPSGTKAQSSVQPASAALASAAEQKVAIPVDESELRFTLSPPEAPIQVASSAGSREPALQTAAQNQTVVPATYNAPLASEPSGSSPTFTLDDTAVVSPWRPPQISQSIAAAAGVAASPPVAAPVHNPNNMDVRLRAVPSPPAETAGPGAPRIRLPSYLPPQPLSNAGGMAGPVIYTAPMYGPAQRMQPVQPGPLSVAAMPQQMSNQDGFRARGPMR